tara:strand:+ start:197 stop:310 length:114 start_codon:yes stop_codon:yes gene_type:complete
MYSGRSTELLSPDIIMRWFTNAGEMVLDGSEKEGDVL